MLIRETEAIKAEVAGVKAKVGRATALLGSLGAERERWGLAAGGFQGQVATLAGDALLAAAFCTPVPTRCCPQSNTSSRLHDISDMLFAHSQWPGCSFPPRICVFALRHSFIPPCVWQVRGLLRPPPARAAAA